MSASKRNTGLKALFVGAHPDDCEISAGGTICRFVQSGWIVVCVFVTRGDRGGDPDVRTAESIAACTRLGVQEQNIVFGDFKDTLVPDSYETIAFLEQFVSPDTRLVFIPSAHERHQDHRHIAECGVTAFRNVPGLFSMESPSTTANFVPSMFVDINGSVRQKALALRCHKTQLAKCQMCLEYRSMMRLASFRGRQAGVKFAEAFEVHRHLLDP